MKDEKCFLDTNIILYCYAEDEPVKHRIALEVAGNPQTIISSQVIKETCNILRQKVKLSWQKIESVIDEIECNNGVIQVRVSTIRKTIYIGERYQLQWFDSIIVASALAADCTTLYSEDFQHELKIENLVIKNPFLTAQPV